MGELGKWICTATSKTIPNTFLHTSYFTMSVRSWHKNCFSSVLWIKVQGSDESYATRKLRNVQDIIHRDQLELLPFSSSTWTWQTTGKMTEKLWTIRKLTRIAVLYFSPFPISLQLFLSQTFQLFLSQALQPHCCCPGYLILVQAFQPMRPGKHSELWRRVCALLSAELAAMNW